MAGKGLPGGRGARGAGRWARPTVSAGAEAAVAEELVRDGAARRLWRITTHYSGQSGLLLLVVVVVVYAWRLTGGGDRKEWFTWWWWICILMVVVAYIARMLRRRGISRGIGHPMSQSLRTRLRTSAISHVGSIPITTAMWI